MLLNEELSHIQLISEKSGLIKLIMFFKISPLK